jgi:CheY-like chemotaxis protein
LMGGQIGAENLPGGGSRFWFSLSLPLVTDGVDSEAMAPPVVPTSTLTHQRPMRVLLAEDNAFSQELIRTCLKPLGCELQTVDNGQAAVIAAQRQAYDLILMDIRMPGMDGHAATRAIRALGEAWLRVPIIALSGNVLPADVDECLAAGMNDHVGKPILPSALFAAIDRHVRVGP